MFTHTYVARRGNVYMHIQKHTSIYTYIHTFICTYTSRVVEVCIFIHPHTLIYIYIHTYIRTYRRRGMWNGSPTPHTAGSKGTYATLVWTQRYALTRLASKISRAAPAKTMRAGTLFTCFTRSKGTQFTCFTRRKEQILTQLGEQRLVQGWQVCLASVHACTDGQRQGRTCGCVRVRGGLGVVCVCVSVSVCVYCVGGGWVWVSVGGCIW
jgi:hypothetical protein